MSYVIICLSLVSWPLDQKTPARQFQANKRHSQKYLVRELFIKLEILILICKQEWRQKELVWEFH